jgi:hypothetical protein
MDEQLFSTGLDFIEHADVAQCLEVLRRRLPFRQACLDDVRDAAVGLDEDQLDEFAGIDRR